MKALSGISGSFLILFLCLAIQLRGQDRNLLTNSSNDGLLVDQVLDPGDWVPFPVYSDRDAWKDVSQGKEHVYVEAGEKALDFDWCPPKATDYLDFVRTGSRAKASAYLNARRTHLRNLVLAELM